MASRIFSNFHWSSSHAKVPRIFFWIQSCFFNILYVVGFPDIIVRATMLCDVTHQYQVICWSKDKFLMVMSVRVCCYCCCHIPVTEFELWWGLSIISQTNQDLELPLGTTESIASPELVIPLIFAPINLGFLNNCCMCHTQVSSSKELLLMSFVYPSYTHKRILLYIILLYIISEKILSHDSDLLLTGILICYCSRDVGQHRYTVC